jgi:hypothetical protein
VTKFRYREARAILCGELIGEGSARKVYELRTNPDFVIKIETAGRSFQNVSEYETWQWVAGGPLAKWFAPCQFISPCGLLLVQRKVEPLRIAELPPRLPAFLCDLKRENFGLLAKRIVCCDYGTAHSAIRIASKRLVRAKWR